MANTSTVVVINQTDPLDLNSRDGKEALIRLRRRLNGFINGSKRAASIDIYADGTIPVRAFEIVDLTSCAANTVIEVNGVPFTALTSGTATVANNEFDISGTDAQDAVKLAAAINNCTNSAIQYVVGGAAVGADTLTASTAIAGNSFTVVLADGTSHKFTGKAGASTTGSAHFSVDTSNTAVTADITTQVNAYTPFSGKVTATNSTSTTVLFNSADGQTFTLTGTATTLAESDSGKCIVRSKQAGALGGALTVKTLGVVATGTVTYVTPSGAQTVVINGVTPYSATAGATATLTAAAAAAAINASTNALVSGHVRAFNRAGVCVILAKYSGTIGNQMTLAATGTGSTASGTRLTGGTETSSAGAQATGTFTLTSVANTETCTVNGVTLTAHTNTDANNQFRIDGTDTQDAASLALAINNSTSAALQDVIATSSSTVCTVTARRGGISGNVITIASGQASIVASAARLTSGAVPTTVTPPTQRLTSGTGGEATVVSVTL